MKLFTHQFQHFRRSVGQPTTYGEYVSHSGTRTADGTFAGANPETPCVALGGASAPARLTSANPLKGLTRS